MSYIVHRTAMQLARFITHDPAILLSLSRPVVSGLVHPDRSISSFLLLILILLGTDRGVAVLHGSDRSPQESHYTQAFPVSRLGWAFSLLSVMVSGVFYPSYVKVPILFSPPGLPALVVAISVGFTKAKGYGTPS